MHDLIELIRKIEVLFLPLFPVKWQDPPPSYRLILPFLKKLGQYEKRFPWAGALLYSVQEEIYPPYHRDRIAIPKSQDEMKWMRFILIVILMALLLVLLGKGGLFSPWVKACFLFGSSALFIYGAMHISISALWMTWGFLFPVIGSLAIGISPWAMVFLASWGLLWHLPAVRVERSWKWYEGLSTFPILFFWIGHVSKMIYIWPLWLSSLLSVVLWLSIWITLVHLKGLPWLSRAFQLFWPASLTLICVIGFVNPGLSGIYRWGLWLMSTLGLSLGMSLVTSGISPRSLFFRWETILIVLGIYGISLFLSGNFSMLIQAIESGLLQLFNSMEILWWIVGAGIIMSIRGIVLILLKWLQEVLPKWAMLSALWVLPVVIIFLSGLSPIMKEIGKLTMGGYGAAMALGATLLVWRRKENLFREWMFWGIFIIFLFRQYVSEAREVIGLYWGKPSVGHMGLITLSVWLLWLNYYTVGKCLKKFEGKINGKSLVVFIGALLWLMVALLWVSYVDQQFSIRGRIQFDLFKGFTFLGIPFIIYHLILGQYSKGASLRDFPWGLILIVGIGVVQILQGIEHSVVAWIEGVSLDHLQKFFQQTLLKGIPLEKAIPPWVMRFSWVFLWRMIRWFIVMITFTIILHRHAKRAWTFPNLAWMACFTSLAVWTAEGTWFFWPSMPLEWAVVLRPWVQDIPMWNESSLQLYALYLIAGLLWGWIFYKFIKRQTL